MLKKRIKAICLACMLVCNIPIASSAIDKEEFLTYNPHYGGLIVIKIYGKTHRSVMIHDSEGNIHSASCKKLVKQNRFRM